jgi:signal transduction histidine kinase
MKRRFALNLSRSLSAKLFISHFLVALVVAFTLLAALYLIAPVIFGRLMAGMMDSGTGMMQPSEMGGMMGSVGRAFGLTLLYSLLVAGVVAAVVAALSSLFVSRRISNPLRRMSAATRRIAAGRYGERVPVGEPDELGVLSENFNSMATSLEEAERKRLELIGDVSHELRTPLSTLQGYMEGLMEGIVEPSDETWALLYGEAERMRRLVDDLRRLSQAEAKQLDLHPVPVSPGEVVRAATERMVPLFDEKGVALASTAPDDLPQVFADGDRVVQVLTNLLGNALRHTPKGGRVSVDTVVRGDSVVFGVEDTGQGIAPEHLPHVFERFYRAEKSRSRSEARGGSGLGLAISKALVEAMGGSMRAGSPGTGKGARFYFSLPLANRQSRSSENLI